MFTVADIKTSSLLQLDNGMVLFNVREASQELTGLVRDLELVEGGREPELDLNEGRLAVSLAHAYHHLNGLASSGTRDAASGSNIRGK